MEFLVILMVMLGLTVFSLYKFISLPFVANLLYMYYASKIAVDIIQEVKRPIHTPLREYTSNVT